MDLTDIREENSQYRKWFKHWNDWKTNLDDETWEKVANGDYKDHLPEKNWNEVE